MNVIPHGQTPRQVAARINWAKRYDRWGPSGLSPEKRDQQRAVVQAAIAAVRKKGRSKKCRAGHVMTEANTRLGRIDQRNGHQRRYCRACDAVALGRAIWQRMQRRKLRALRDAMIAVHPDKGGTPAKFRKARRAYLRAQAV